MTERRVDAPPPQKTPDDRATGDEKGALKRNISGRMLYLFILGDVLGAGIYALVGQIAGQVGGVTWAPMIVALLLALLTAASTFRRCSAPSSSSRPSGC
jgi:APA family basic amino acid/polyamine antiporter